MRSKIAKLTLLASLGTLGLPGTASAYLFGPYFFTVPGGPAVDDLHVSFTTPGGTLPTLGGVTQTAGPLGVAAAVGNTIDVTWGAPLPVGAVIGLTFNTNLGETIFSAGSWTAAGVPAGPANPVPSATITAPIFTAPPQPGEPAPVVNNPGTVTTTQIGDTVKTSVTGLDVTVGGPTPVQIFSAKDDVAITGNRYVSIFGSTQMRVAGLGRAQLIVQGFVNNLPNPVVQTRPIQCEYALCNVEWAASSNPMDFTFPPLTTLEERAILSWDVFNPGATVRVTSEYDVKTSVPEPSTLALLTAALGGFFGLRRRSMPANVI